MEHLSSRERGWGSCQLKDHITCTHLLHWDCSPGVMRDSRNGLRGTALSLYFYHWISLSSFHWSLLWTWPHPEKVKPERCKISAFTMTLCWLWLQGTAQSLFSWGSALHTQHCFKSWQDNEVCFSYLDCFFIGTTSFYTVPFTKKP